MWLNKQTENLKNNTISYCLFTCGGPCHLFKLQTLFRRPYSPPKNSLFIQIRKKVLCHYLINIVNLKIMSLDFLCETTQSAPLRSRKDGARHKPTKILLGYTYLNPAKRQWTNSCGGGKKTKHFNLLVCWLTFRISPNGPTNRCQPHFQVEHLPIIRPEWSCFGLMASLRVCTAAAEWIIHGAALCWLGGAHTDLIREPHFINQTVHIVVTHCLAVI